MVATGLFEYSWPRTFCTRWLWETPRPSTMRPGASSPSVLRIAVMVIGSRA